ncbi:MAG TPA: type VI secretion system baseplate subunit TssK [Phycisphaerales bacterium]|nr:type VI secretion system baseplate subunit TssK [Phycisphaerales bacterium]
MFGNGTSAVMQGQVHWHEGLFLQPHHLQTFQRQISDTLAFERRLGTAYPYGVIDVRLSQDALENMLIRFDQLKLVMPSGLYVDVPGNADLAALDIKRALQATSQPLTVSLAIPVWQAARANTIESRSDAGVQIKRLFRVSEVDRADENTGENRQPVLIRRINARLVLSGDDTQDMETMPLVRIIRASGDDQGRPMEDKQFIPPCMFLSGSATLRNLVRDLGNHLETLRRETLTSLMRGGVFSRENLRGAQITQLMRLQALNRAAARIPLLARTPSVTPLDAYLEMRDALGELAALFPERDSWAVSDYDHDAPGAVFTEVDRRIRSLGLEGAAPIWKADFQKDGQVLSVELEDKHVTTPTEYFLGIRTKQDPVALARLVESQDKFKLMPKSMERLMVLGVKLEEERHPPYELPSQPGLHYFRLVRADSKTMWDRIVQEKKAAIRWPEGESFDFSEVSLYMTLPGEA